MQFSDPKWIESDEKDLHGRASAPPARAWTTQVALAQLLGISPSYLNQIEQNQRPLTVQVLLKLSGALGVDVQRFSEDDEAAW